MKKILSFVLIATLVLSSFSISFAEDNTSSAAIADYDSIQNTEAVELMMEAGIITGYPDGNYYPQEGVTRAQMAKMIAVAINGGEDIDMSYADKCYFSDSANHWAAKYIAYCAEMEIISGKSADTFEPDLMVTGLDAAKMLLIAIGFDPIIEGFTGTLWDSNVLNSAKENALYEGMTEDFVAGAALNRDNAAQIIYNGLKANVVEYAYDMIVSTEEASVTVNTTIEKIYLEKENTLDVNNDGYLQLYEKSFKGNLIL